MIKGRILRILFDLNRRQFHRHHRWLWIIARKTPNACEPHKPDALSPREMLYSCASRIFGWAQLILCVQSENGTRTDDCDVSFPTWAWRQHRIKGELLPRVLSSPRRCFCEASEKERVTWKQGHPQMGFPLDLREWLLFNFRNKCKLRILVIAIYMKFKALKLSLQSSLSNISKEIHVVSFMLEFSWLFCFLEQLSVGIVLRVFFLFERQGYLSCYHTNPLATRKTYGIKQDEYLNSPHIMGGMDANNTMSGQSLLVLHLFITKLHIWKFYW